jgi:hypothetical protein
MQDRERNLAKDSTINGKRYVSLRAASRVLTSQDARGDERRGAEFTGLGAMNCSLPDTRDRLESTAD